MFDEDKLEAETKGEGWVDMAKDTEATSAASLLGKLRWKGKTDDEKSTFMKSVRAKRSNAPGGRNGGRPLSTDRCYCGECTWTRAMARAFGCCKKAGKFPSGNPTAQLMGLKRASALTEEQRRDIASKGSAARWERVREDERCRRMVEIAERPRPPRPVSHRCPCGGYTAWTAAARGHKCEGAPAIGN